jgi:hypothetical protein
MIPLDIENRPRSAEQNASWIERTLPRPKSVAVCFVLVNPPSVFSACCSNDGTFLNAYQGCRR